MLTTYPDLLPPTSTAFESALAGPTGRITAIPVPLRDLWRWDTCPDEHLPWLAWAMSVDLWSDAWPVEKKRAMIRESFELHRHKGTQWAIERYLAYAGAKLRKAIVPPDKPFLGRSMTADERQRWLDRFPQLRLYQYRTRGAQTFGAYLGNSYKLGKSFLDGNCFPAITDAADRIGRRAFLWDKGTHPLATGEETALHWLERDREHWTGVGVEQAQVLIPGSKVRAIFPGQVRGNLDGKSGRMFFVASSAARRIVTIDVDHEYTASQDYLTQRTIAPSLDPINAFPVPVGERGQVKPGQIFLGMPGRWLDRRTGTRHRVKGYLHGFLPATTAPLRIYDQLYLHDPERLPDRRNATLFPGAARFGMPAFHAELHVEIRGKRSKHAVNRFLCGHFVTSDQAQLRLARQAATRSMALRDKIALRTALHRPIRVSDRVRLSEQHRVGGLIEIY